MPVELLLIIIRGEMASKKEIICNVCGYDHHLVVFESSNYNKRKKKKYFITDNNITPPSKIVRCIRCGHIFVPHGDGADRIISNYEKMIDEKYVGEEKGRRVTARCIIKKLSRFKKYGNHLLDVGCSIGFFLDEAKEKGWKVFGVEPSEWASHYATEQLNLKVYNTTLENAKLQDNYFNVVVMLDTIEHLLNPGNVLIEIKRILKPNGILYINTPDVESAASRILRAKWWGINRYHLHYFSKKTLSKLLTSVGFRDMKYSTYIRTFTLKYWIERCKNYNRFLYNMLLFISKISNSENKLIQVNLRDQIEVFARK